MLMTRHIANILTGCRILGSVLLLFSPVLTLEFYIVYIFCGLTDMVDGTIARMTNSDSIFGGKFDAVADFVFVVAASIKLLPIIHVPLWLLIWSSAIAIIKISNIVCGSLCAKRFITLHTIMNKVTGLLLFILPLTLSFIELRYSAVVVCCIATVSAVHEGFYIAIGFKNK